MSYLAESTEDYEDGFTEIARDQAIRDWERYSQPMVSKSGIYVYSRGHTEDYISRSGIKGNDPIRANTSDTPSDKVYTDDYLFLKGNQISTKSQTKLSLIEGRYPYFRKKTVENELREYLWLEEGWDGVRSVPAPASAVENAISFLHRFPDTLMQPTPMVASDGEVGLYWRYQGAYVELEFAGDGMMFGYGRDLNGKELLIDDVSLDSTEGMENAIATLTRIVAEFPLNDDQNG
jgi:hypothetical protein